MNRFYASLANVQLGDVSEMVRIPLMKLGKWVKGAVKFAIGQADVARICENFRKRMNGEVVIDYEHASEMPGVAQGQPIPAAGWLREIEPEPDADGIVWGLAEFTQRAREMIGAGEYKYISPALDFGARNKSSGEAQGATLTSCALVNRPFFDMLPAVTLSDDWKEEVVSEEKVIRLSDVQRTEDGRLNFAALSEQTYMIHPEVIGAWLIASELDAAVKEGKITPAQRPIFEKLTLSDLRTVIATMKPQVDLSEKGHAGGAGDGMDLKRVDARIKELAQAKLAGNKDLTYGQAVKLVLSENAELAAQKARLMQEGGK